MRNIKKSITFSGGLGNFCTQFVAEKRNLGYSYKTEEYLLKRFDHAANLFPTSSRTMKPARCSKP